MTTALEQLRSLMDGRRTVVLTGAGCSTESGIPDYRGSDSGGDVRRPMTYRTFLGSAGARARYWARSTVGWSRIASARPNPSHVALTELERSGHVRGIITQNVDRLHTRAGSESVVELHGALERVRCMGCERRSSRAAMQRRLTALNPQLEGAEAVDAPDGDADLAERHLRGFRVPECRWCGGILKPDVVFFGESVPRKTVEAAWALFAQAELLLVVGSSLTVFSGYRFALRASQEGTPLAIVNLGPTRADEMATVAISEASGRVLPRLASRLGVSEIPEVA